MITDDIETAGYVYPNESEFLPTYWNYDDIYSNIINDYYKKYYDWGDHQLKYNVVPPQQLNSIYSDVVASQPRPPPATQFSQPPGLYPALHPGQIFAAPPEEQPKDQIITAVKKNNNHLLVIFIMVILFIVLLNSIRSIGPLQDFV